jgi:hypothetical protein
MRCAVQMATSCISSLGSLRRSEPPHNLVISPHLSHRRSDEAGTPCPIAHVISSSVEDMSDPPGMSRVSLPTSSSSLTDIRIENPVSAQPLPGSARRRGGTSEDLIDLTEDDPPLISPIPPKASEPEQVLRFPSGLPQFPADSAVFTVFDLPFRGRVNLCSYLAA